jgi:hypothetical protein
MHNRILLISFGLITAASLLWVFLNGGSQGLSDLRTCSDLAAGGYCSESKEEFDTDGSDIFASVHVRSDTERRVAIRWVYVLDGIESTIAEGERAISAVGYHSFKLTRPEAGWQEGRYRVEVEFLTDVQTAEFEIR